MNKNSFKNYVRYHLDAGHSIKEIWRIAEIERWHAPWNYILKIKRDWEREKTSSITQTPQK